jgi:DNA-binding FrmR family transcriptional regulator
MPPYPILTIKDLIFVIRVIPIHSIMAKSHAPHAHTHPEDETAALRLRMRKIVGQLQGVEKMLETDRDCGEVLTQIISARRGLKALSEILIHSHFHHCIEAATNQAEAKHNLREMLVVLERYIE